MQNSLTYRPLINKLRILLCVILLEYLLFIFSGVSFSFLHGNGFFSVEVDPASWPFYLLRIPQFITGHQWAGILLDITIVVLLVLLIRDPFTNIFAILVFILLLLFYVTLMGYLVHRNYQFGFFIVLVPFLFRKKVNKEYAYEATRYFLLFFYVSAAFLKLSGQALTDHDQFSHLLSGQFTPYFLEANTGLRTNVNLYLVGHPTMAYSLYLASFFAELTTIIGFFTKRFDKWIAVIILGFHFGNWFIMDIAPFGQIAFICLLFLSKEMGLKKN